MAVKRLLYAAFVAFLASVATIAVLAKLAPAPQPAAAKKVFSSEEVARHHSVSDCWMTIDGAVYDVTAYIPLHPTEPDVVVRWCGKDASEAFATKGYGRPHGPAAYAALKKYFVGELGSS